MATDNIDIIIQAKVDQAVKNIVKTRKASERLGDSAVNSSKKVDGSLSKLKGGYLAIAAVLTGVVAAAFARTIKLASDFIEANSKFNTIFRDVSKEADNMRKVLVSSYNLSNKAATELLANTGDILSGFGFTGKEALRLSGEVNKLAADLSSFANIPIEQASQAITRGLLGERESMKTLGIAILETDVQQRLFEKGQKDLTGEALRQAKAQATLELAMEQSRNAIGDSERTANSFANVMRTIGNIIEDVRVTFGTAIITAIKPLIQQFRDFGLTETFTDTISVVTRLIAGGLLPVVVILRTAMLSVQTVINGVATSLRTLGGIIKGVFTGDLKAAIKAGRDGVGEFGKNATDAFLGVKDIVTDTIGSISDLWNNNLEGMTAATEQAGNKWVKTLTEARKSSIKAFEEGTQQIGGIAQQGFDVASQFIDNQIAKDDNRKQIAMDNLEEQFAAGLLTQEQFEQQKQALEEQSEKKSAELKKKAFIADKASAIIGSIVNTALAVTRALTAGPFAGPVLAGIVGGLGAAQTAAIAAAPIPAFQTGGNFVTDGPQLIKVGDNPSGRERVTIEPEGGSVTNNNNTTSNDNRNININVQASNSIDFVNDLKREYGVDVFN